MIRLMLVLMVATGVCGCTSVRTGIADISGNTSDAFAFCQVTCEKSLSESDALTFVRYDLDAVVRDAPF